MKPSTTDDEISALSWPECARLCKSESPRPDTEIAFVRGQKRSPAAKVLRDDCVAQLAAPPYRVPDLGARTWRAILRTCCARAAAQGDDRETSLDLARTRLVTFKVRFTGGGNPISEYLLPREPLLDGELEAAAAGLGLPFPLIAAGTPETDKANDTGEEV
jgi:hypothetical protein